MITLPESKPEAFLNAIVSSLKDEFGGIAGDIKTIKKHGGRFTPEELKRLPAQAPAVFVALTKLPRPQSPLHKHERWAHISMAIITKTTSEISRDMMAIRLTTAITRHVQGNNWGINSVLGVDAVTDVTNIYSANIDKKNIAMWSLSFRQLITI